MKKEEKQREKQKRLQDDTGEPSLGRWMVYYGTILSGVLVTTGVIISIFEVAIQPYLIPNGVEALVYHTSVGIPMIATGVGIYTSGALAKSWQTHAEAEKMSAGTNSGASGDSSGTEQPNTQI